MRKDKNKAFELRNFGKSYAEIKNQLGVPKATLSDWFSDKDWSKDIAISLAKKAEKASGVRIQYLNKIRGEHLRRVYDEARKEAVEELEVLQHHPLFIAGVMIYWGEGDKVSPNNFRITNSDPAMVQLFLAFLTKICKLDSKRIRASLLLYPDLDDETCRIFWIKNTGLATSNFTKSIRIQGHHKTRKLQYGVCTMTFSSTYMKEKMLVWIKLLPALLLAK